MSDLQCPARLVLVTATADAAEPSLRARLAAESVRAVYTANGIDPVPWYGLADALGAPWFAAPGDLADGSDEILEIVDRHRGEAVLVVRAAGASGDGADAAVLVLVDADGESRRPF